MELWSYVLPVRWVLAPYLHPVGKLTRHLQASERAPVIRVSAIAGCVMDNQKIADSVHAVIDCLIVAEPLDLQIAREGEVTDELLDTVLNEEDARRLKRLDESAGQADRDAVPH